MPRTENMVSRSQPEYAIVRNPLPLPPSSLEDRVRILCDQAIAARTQAELDAILPELKAAIKDHIRYVRVVAVETIPEVFGTRSKSVA